MSAIATLLSGLTTTGTRIERTRVRTVETTPALTLEQGGGDVITERSSFPYVARDLNVKVIAYVKKNSAMDTQINLISREVYVAMLADRTLGLTFVTDTFLLSDDEPEFGGEAEKKFGMMQMNFVVQYRHDWDDPGA